MGIRFRDIGLKFQTGILFLNQQNMLIQKHVLLAACNYIWRRRYHCVLIIIRLTGWLKYFWFWHDQLPRIAQNQSRALESNYIREWKVLI